jgi:hypothetical protein
MYPYDSKLLVPSDCLVNHDNLQSTIGFFKSWSHRKIMQEEADNSKCRGPRKCMKESPD